MSKVKVAVVGVGTWGKNIVRAFKELEKEGLVELTALVDVNQKVVEEVSKSFGVKHYTSDIYDLKRFNVSAVAIATPIDKLYITAREAISLGMHVFVEKPVAIDPKEINDLIKISNEIKVAVQPGFIVRYDPVIKALLSRVKTMPKYVVFKRLSSRPQHRRSFPLVFDLTIHDIDIALALTKSSKIEVLSVVGLKKEFETYQEIHVKALFNDTAVYFITDGLLPVKVRVVEIALSDAYYQASLTESLLKVYSTNGVVLEHISGEEPLIAELRDFINNVRGVPNPERPTLQDALRACVVANEIQQKLNYRNLGK